jgi:methylglutamate dehydrogenase subunit B
MRVNCPFCGDRDVSEFHCLGGKAPARPDPRAADAVAQFADYVYLRDNAAGLHEELWYHGFGCRAWLIVERNTLTHEISGVRTASGEEPGRRR